MSHVDEGMVHAYLDDALDDVRRAGFEQHVAQCIECAALLREEERVRNAAALLLVRAAPDEVAVPPFAGVRARSAEAARVPARRRVPPLAWAAMLVIGLGSAVMTARFILPGTGSTERMTDAETAAAPSASMAEAPQAAETQVTSEERVASGAGGAVTGGAQSNARNEAAPPAPLEPQQRADNRALAARERDARDELRAGEAELARGADRPAMADATTGAVAAAPAPPPPAPAAPPQAAASAYEVTAGRAVAANAWRASTQAEAEELLGARIARVPGVAVLSVEVLHSELPLIRVRQSLGAVVLELTQQRVPSNPRRSERQQDAAQRNNAGAAEGNAGFAMAKAAAPAVSVRRGDVLITAQAPVSADSLSALLRRIE